MFMIACNEVGSLIYDPLKKIISFIGRQDNHIFLTARFFHDVSDGTALLSELEFTKTSEERKDLIKSTTDLISSYLLSKHIKSKLFCLLQPEQAGSLSNDYQSTLLDRVMLRSKYFYAENLKSLSPGMKATKLNIDSITRSEVEQILHLLRQTYWAKGANAAYVHEAVQLSTFLVMRDAQGQIIGLVRSTTNGHFAYVGDMVVDEAWRKQGIATVLMKNLLQLIDANQNELTILITAREGDGKDASPRLYGDKFGFVKYSQALNYHLFSRSIERALICTDKQTDKLSVAPHANLFAPPPVIDTKADIMPNQVNNCRCV